MKHIRLSLCLALLAAFYATCTGAFAAAPDASNAAFTLVIDPGHGGNDPGAVGANKTKEKTINLNVALAFGRLVEQNCPDVKVIYTRKTDVFVTLQERANIANRNKANLFISIHTNAVASNKGSVSGAETYTLGMHRAAENLEVAKRENAVITMESDYKTKYQGFDPHKAESYIIFELMQDKNMVQSVKLAKAIQQQYAAAGRLNKGVHQAGFLVLRETSMPSVLTELGFISHPREEAYLASNDGVQRLARSLYDGFRNYRRQLAVNEEEPAADLPTERPLPSIGADLLAYQQNGAHPHFNEGATPSTTFPENFVPRLVPVPTTPYPTEASQQLIADTVVTAPTSAAKAEEPKKEVKAEEPKPAPKAEEPKKEVKAEEPKKAEEPAPAAAPNIEFRIQLFTAEREIREGDAQLKGLPVAYYRDGTTYKYTYGQSANYQEIADLKKTIADKFPGVFIIALCDGKRMDLQEAIKISKQNK